MSDTLASLRRKIGGATDLESVVRSMKALAAASIGQYERSVLALSDYYRAIELALVVCMRKRGTVVTDEPLIPFKTEQTVIAIVFGSDQGLVGQFNDLMADFAARTLKALPGEKRVWAVGERVHARLTDVGLQPVGLFAVPTSINGITPLVGRILVESQLSHLNVESVQLHLFHNQPVSGATYEPASQRLLPLDEKARIRLAHLPWPTRNLPEVIGDREQTLRALVGEYLFVSLYKACAESLASENASRLAAMQRAEKNIDDLLDHLNQKFRRLRQSSIDEELFDVLAGYESLAKTHSLQVGCQASQKTQRLSLE